MCSILSSEINITLAGYIYLSALGERSHYSARQCEPAFSEPTVLNNLLHGRNTFPPDPIFQFDSLLGKTHKNKTAHKEQFCFCALGENRTPILSLGRICSIH